MSSVLVWLSCLCAGQLKTVCGFISMKLDTLLGIVLQSTNGRKFSQKRLEP